MAHSGDTTISTTLHGDEYERLFRRSQPHPPPSRRRPFPNGWRDATYFAWALAGFGALFMFTTAGVVLLRLAVHR